MSSEPEYLFENSQSGHSKQLIEIASNKPFWVMSTESATIILYPEGNRPTARMVSLLNNTLRKTTHSDHSKSLHRKPRVRSDTAATL